MFLNKITFFYAFIGIFLNHFSGVTFAATERTMVRKALSDQSVEKVGLSLNARRALAVGIGLWEGSAKFGLAEIDNAIVPFEVILTSKVLREYYLKPSVLITFLPPQIQKDHSDQILASLKSVNLEELAVKLIDYLRLYREGRDVFFKEIGSIVDQDFPLEIAEVLEAIVRMDYQYFKTKVINLVPLKYQAILPTEEAVVSLLDNDAQIWAQLAIKGDVNGLQQKFMESFPSKDVTVIILFLLLPVPVLLYLFQSQLISLYPWPSHYMPSDIANLVKIIWMLWRLCLVTQDAFNKVWPPVFLIL